MFSKHVETLSSDSPIFVRFTFIFCDVHFVTKVSDFVFDCYKFVFYFFLILSCDLDKKNELWYTSCEYHHCFRNKFESKLDGSKESERFEEIKKEFNCEFHTVVIVCFKTIWLEGEYLVYDVTYLCNIRHKYRKKICVRFCRHKFECNLSNNS